MPINDHSKTQISVRFLPHKIKQWCEETSNESEDELDPEKFDPTYNKLCDFFGQKDWVLTGKRDELESQLEKSLGGNLWLGKGGCYEGQLDSPQGCYQDNFICRFINKGLAQYVN